MTDTTAILDHLTAEQDEAAGLEHGIKADEWDRLITLMKGWPVLFLAYPVSKTGACAYQL